MIFKYFPYIKLSSHSLNIILFNSEGIQFIFLLQVKFESNIEFPYSFPWVLNVGILDWVWHLIWVNSVMKWETDWGTNFQPVKDCSNTICWKHLFPIVLPLLLCQGSVEVCVCMFMDAIFCSIDWLPVFSPIPNSLEYCSFDAFSWLHSFILSFSRVLETLILLCVVS